MPGMTSMPRKGRRDFEPANCLNESGMDCDKSRRKDCEWMGSNSHAPCGLVTCKVLGPQGPLLTNRMSELLTYGSVGGVGRKPGPYPAANPAIASRLQSNALVGRVAELGSLVVT